MARRGADRVDRPHLHDPAEIEDDDPVAHELDDIEVVADEEHGHAEAGAEVLQQVQHLRLHRDVERGDGSSATISSGSTASARAMPMRWRWPPENSCG